MWNVSFRSIRRRNELSNYSVLPNELWGVRVARGLKRCPMFWGTYLFCERVFDDASYKPTRFSAISWHEHVYFIDKIQKKIICDAIINSEDWLQLSLSNSDLSQTVTKYFSSHIALMQQLLFVFLILLARSWNICGMGRWRYLLRIYSESKFGWKQKYGKGWY